MKNAKFRKILSVVLSFVLVAVIALFASACNQPTSSNDGSKPSSNPASSAPETPKTEDNVYGEGATTFTLKVTFKDGSTETYTINTDKKIVGEALVENNLIAGEEGAYGLYIKTVAGETVAFDTDGKYWAFYIDGEYAMTGVDTTEIDTAAVYELKVE